MVTTLQIKRTTTGGRVPPNNSLAQGELACDMVTPKLYVGVPSTILASGVQLIVDASVIAGHTSSIGTLNTNVGQNTSQLNAIHNVYLNADSTGGNNTANWVPGTGWWVFQNGSKAMAPVTTGRLAARLYMDCAFTGPTTQGQIFIGLWKSTTAFPGQWTSASSAVGPTQFGQIPRFLQAGGIVGQMRVDWTEYLYGVVTTPQYYYAAFSIAATAQITIYGTGLTVWEF